MGQALEVGKTQIDFEATHCWYDFLETPTVDGSEILRSPVEVGSLSHYLQGFIHPKSQVGFSRRISEPSTVWSIQNHLDVGYRIADLLDGVTLARSSPVQWIKWTCTVQLMQRNGSMRCWETQSVYKDLGCFCHVGIMLLCFFLCEIQISQGVFSIFFYGWYRILNEFGEFIYVDMLWILISRIIIRVYLGLMLRPFFKGEPQYKELISGVQSDQIRLACWPLHIMIAYHDQSGDPVN